MFNLVDERIERRFWNLAVVLVFICFIFTFSSAVCGYENDNRGENKTQMFENNYLQYMTGTQVVFTSLERIKSFPSNPNVISCAGMMDVSIKKNIDLNIENAENYFQQKSFSERLNISNENQNNSGTKGLKKALIVTGEFTCSFFLSNTIMYATYSYLDVNDYIERYSYPVSYLIGEPLGATFGTLAIGKLFHENGSTKGAVIGSLVGTAVGFWGFYVFLGKSNLEQYDEGLIVSFVIASFSPSLGSVIGYNIRF